ncbi:hypothetical protein TRFO_10760 [Tritrichomonas foetus]|uniref:Uncharacterized protein n=1 Tax=Tritrichomonas foetus TaxID=1144522 RepID=A0A1J4J7B3_9EUKA|nr:hypothetical protein TRFO_10760 [Tritrichomonas foetus]|eukprot:OHS95040.1 hypothetical protein TRFO_10760 [Tritrichomonas foetus]
MFPLNTDPTADSTEAFLISFSPTSQYYALLNPDTVSVFNNVDPLFPLVFKYRRDSKSLKTNGPNHWFQWITDSSFAFGTCPGEIFFFLSLSQNRPITFSANTIISSTFSAHGYLGVCINGPRILFFKDGVSFSEIEIQNTFPSPSCQFIKSTKFYKNSIILGFINERPFISNLSKIMIESKWKITFKNLKIENPQYLAINPNNSSIAYSTFQNEVKITNLYDQEKGNIKIFDGDAEIHHLFWINDFTELCIIKENGILDIWNTSNNFKFHCLIPELKNAKFLEFDDFTKTLLCLDGKSLINISFCQLAPPLCLTSNAVYSISTGKKIASIHNYSQFNNLATLPPNIFPITQAIESPDADIAIYGGNILVSITDNKLFFIKLENLTQMIWCDGKIYAFCSNSSNSSHILEIFTKELKKIGSVSSPHCASSISASGEKRIIISNKNYFTVFDFDVKNVIEKPSTSKYMTYLIDWDGLILVITTFTVRDSLLNAICGYYNDIWLHFSNKNVVNFPSNEIIEKNVQKIWNHVRPRLIFMQQENCIKIADSSSIYEFKDISPLCSSGPDFVLLNPNYKYGHFPFTTCDFAFQIMQKNLDHETNQNLLFPTQNQTNVNHINTNNTNIDVLDTSRKCFEFAQSIISIKEFNYLMNQLCIYSLQKGKMIEFINILNLFDRQSITSIISHLDKHLQCILAEHQFDFSPLFVDFQAEIQCRILVKSKPCDFINLLNNHADLICKFDDQTKSNIIHELIIAMEWSKLSRFAEIWPSVDLPSKLITFKELRALEFKQTLKIIENDYIKWKEFQQFDNLKMLGLSFIVAELGQWAISCFIVIRDIKKINFLLNDNVKVSDEVNEYVTSIPDDSHSIFLSEIIQQNCK